MSGNWSLEQFFDHVDQVQADMRARGVVTVYFQHDQLTPGQVRATREDVPIRDVPEEGAAIDLPHAGYMGAPAHWRVKRVEWLAGPGVVLHMTDAGQEAT